ncbi:MAG: vWA domain-containing protein [Bryobacteraceae bacterium]
MHPDLNQITDKPVFAGILIDSSGSMEPYTSAVIEAHKVMLDMLRKSEKCVSGVLWVYQCLFAGTPQPLNSFYPLRPDGHDKVTVLSASNYKPSGRTALYDAVLTMTKELDAQRQGAFRRGLPSGARIAVITDGEDNESQPGAVDQVKAAIGDLRSKEWLDASVVVGLKNKEFDETKLKALQLSLGFSQRISLEQSPQEVRRAFVLASRFVAGKA